MQIADRGIFVGDDVANTTVGIEKTACTNRLPAQFYFSISGKNYKLDINNCHAHSFHHIYAFTQSNQ
ncbi:hypothetical protein [Chitinophaga nivalis]|uniref:Peptidase A1 domain-containing protein n=1 Tax=Chitinophaga nivalis TaxID=2991709 RepID=A0ABT3INJ4_9BACT|nr:hypothetical protein [Chitinophaga nivalis]MCW3464958.1 hypothetical protein [Chitinophaga nivalis]MCW3485350.1 hypothetical protein [Chitinophaga nivalis]